MKQTISLRSIICEGHQVSEEEITFSHFLQRSNVRNSSRRSKQYDADERSFDVSGAEAGVFEVMEDSFPTKDAFSWERERVRMSLAWEELMLEGLKVSEERDEELDEGRGVERLFALLGSGREGVSTCDCLLFRDFLLLALSFFDSSSSLPS